MRIGESSVAMSSKSTYTESHIEEESLKFWVGSRPDFEAQKTQNPQNLQNLQKTQNPQNPKLQVNVNDILEISNEGKSELQRSMALEDEETDDGLSNKDRYKIMLIEKFIEMFTGKKIKLSIADKIRCLTDSKNIQNNNPSVSKGNVQRGSNWGLEYDYRKQHYEKATMTFSAKGMVKTSDGRSIEFKVDLDMKREYTSNENISIRAGNAKVVDPLVINLNNNTIKLSDNKINFDLNFDGTKEQISFVSKESGFLALDSNNDGIINDGRELFGPQTGDGFSELAKYDSDGNNWIDENDAVFSKLKIWVKGDSGEDMLFTLAEKGIGALYVGNVNTQFSLKDTSNNLNGEIRKTGVFLNENGTAGTIQHIDLAI